jgi:hypothetical protein
MSDAPIAFEMLGHAYNVLCIERFGVCLDETERRKPNVIG